ncbi:TPA: response regulator transcription factor, partial [Salmonella enterica subsp. diarizonae serovar 61:l,v:z35]
MLKILLSGERCDTITSLQHIAKNYGFEVVFFHYNGNDNIFKSIKIDAIIVISRKISHDICQTMMNWKNFDITIPLMIITDEMRPSFRKEIIMAGIDDIIQKPVTADEIIRRLFAIIVRSNAIPQKVLCYGDLSLDSYTKTVKLKDEIIKLTAKEISILETLLLQGGKVISGRKITETMKKKHNGYTGNIIAVYISSLRKKLGKDLIET